jgi:electron transport complex protein RnfC
VIVNGMLTGRQADGGTLRIDAQSESIILRAPADIEKPAPCLSCGWCVDVCPTGLTPVHLMELAQKTSTPAGTEAAVLRSRSAREARHCIACGLCSYVCPTRLPLMEQTLQLRARVAGAGREVMNAS